MAASPSAAAAPPVAPETAPAPPPQPTPSAKAPLNLARIGSVPDAVWLAVPVAAAVLLEKTVSFVARRFLLNRYGGLDNLVSYTSRMIAAVRAIESARPDALFNDPLAEVLAGKVALQAAKDRQAKDAAASSSSSSSTGAEQQQAAVVRSPRQRSAGRIVVRTLYFDEVILAAASRRTNVRYLSGLLGPGSSRLACTQVVLLGSGMDTRPWRLPLPPGVAWFEVDQSDVLRAKRGLMARHGASFDGGSSGGNSRGAKHPLRAASWACASADLQRQGWTRKLQAAGFDPRQPTVWVLEGLLYYLEPATVPALLAEAASVSAPGSVLSASIISLTFLQGLRERLAERRKAAAGGSRGGKEATQSALESWKWGCPGEPADYFGASGWRVVSCPVWSDTADEWGCAPDLGGSTTPSEQRSQYVTCVLKDSSGLL